MTTWSQITDPAQWVGVTSGDSPPLNYNYDSQGLYFWWPNGASDLSITFNPGVALPEPGILYYQWLVFNANPADGGISDETLSFKQVVGGTSIYTVEWSTITGASPGSVNPGSGSGQTPDLSGMTGFTLENSPGGLGVFGIRFSLTPFPAPTYSAPVLFGTIPSPVAQPLQGQLTWTAAQTGTAPLLLQHFDTNVSDSSGNAISFTATSPASVGTSVTPKFGAGCLDCPTASATGGNDICYSPIAVGGLLDLANVPNWTVEGWINAAATGDNALNLFSMGFYDNSGGASASGILLGNAGGGGTMQVNLYGAAASVQCINNQVSFNPGVWHHFAVVKTAGAGAMGADLLQLYVDGVASIYPQNMRGPYSSWGGANGYIVYGGYRDSNGTWVTGTQTSEGVAFDEVRITAAALYSANFTPPAAPFSISGTPATGYDLYRDGVSIFTEMGSGLTLAFLDTVPAYGTYDYQVFPWDGTMDLLNGSNIFPLTYAASTAVNLGFLDDELICGAFFGGVLNLVEFVYMPEREPFLEGATNMILNRYKQEPGDVRQRGVDYTFFLVPGELVQNVTVSGIYVQGVLQSLTNPLVTPLVVNEVIIDPLGLKFAYTVSGGQDGIEYRVEFTTVTQIQTSNVTEVFSINVLIEDSFP